jgi:hypothetical protein
MARRAFALCGPRRVPQNRLLPECPPRSFANSHRAGRSASPKMRPSNGIKEMLQREHTTMFARMSTVMDFTTRALREKARNWRCHPCNCNHGFSRTRYPRRVRSRGPRTIRRASQYLATDATIVGGSAIVGRSGVSATRTTTASPCRHLSSGGAPGAAAGSGASDGAGARLLLDRRTVEFSSGC